MSILHRKKAEAKARDYFDALYTQYGYIPVNHQMAIDLRMQFFRKYILERRTCEFKSPVEKDWAFIAYREYWYDVNVRSACDAAAAGLSACMVRMFMRKRFIWWPFVPVAAAVYTYRARQLFVLHNKKFFDMCNVGEQYELGFARNAVLKRCNLLIDRHDF